MSIYNFIWIFILEISLVIGAYIYLYHFKKQTILAIAIGSVMGLIAISSIIFVLPSHKRLKDVDVKKITYEIKTVNDELTVVCDDNTNYKLKAINTELTSGFNAYANDKRYKNIKIIVKYKYQYKLWWLIPLYKTTTETNIYINQKKFYKLYGCGLDKKTYNY